MQTFTTNLLIRTFSGKEVSAYYLANRPKICGNRLTKISSLENQVKRIVFYAVIARNLFLTNVPIADEYSGPFQTSNRKLFLQKSSTTTSCYNNYKLSWISNKVLNVTLYWVLYFQCRYPFEVSAIVFSLQRQETGILPANGSIGQKLIKLNDINYFG